MIKRGSSKNSVKLSKYKNGSSNNYKSKISSNKDIKKKIRIGLYILIGFFVVFFIFSLLLSTKLKFFISDELEINLNPLDISIYVDNTETFPIEFTVKNNNFLECKSSCEFTLVNLDNNKLVHKSNEILNHNEEKIKKYVLPRAGKGEGQKLYQFKVTCNNIKTKICLTKEEQREKTALILVNYNLTFEEESIKQIFENNLNMLLSNIVESSKLLSQTVVILERLPTNLRERKDLEPFLNNFSINILNLNKQSNSLNELWTSENYLEGGNKFKVSLIENAIALTSKLHIIFNSTLNTIKLRNDDLDILESLDFTKIITILNFYDTVERSYDYEVLVNIYNDLYNDYTLMLDNSITSQKAIHSDIEDNANKLDIQFNKYDSLLIKGLDLQKNLSITDSEFSCNSLKRGLSMIAISNITNHNYGENNNTFTTNSSNSSKNTNTSENNTNLSIPSPITILINNSQINYSEYINFFNKNCGEKINRTINITTSFLEYGKIDKINETLPLININLSKQVKDNPSKCCFNNNCSACGSISTIPLLFIHGHAFNEENTPETTMNSFTKIQKKLQLDGYIDAGELDVSATNFKIGEWGKSNVPFTTRASYYYIKHYDIGVTDITAQKSEKIENYALRLKEIVDLYSQRTGSDKIIIIAHSMGGLVAREYMSLFGSNKISKLITINTPNNGITNKIAKFCTVLGSVNECKDMTKGSIFLSRLNNAPVPNNIYVIRSSGCDTAGEDGDGIVTLNDAFLEGTTDYIVGGKCTDTFGTNLHTQILDPDIYPETYKIILDILNN